MFIKRANIHLPTSIDFIRHTDAGQNVEGEILALRSAHVGVTVDPAQAEPARKIGNEPPVRPDKIITAAEIDAEVMVLHSAKDRLGHQGETKLIVTASPVVAVVHAPANSSGNKFRPDLVTTGVAENAKQIARLNGDFEPRRIKRFAGRYAGDGVAGKKRFDKKRHAQNSRAEKLHLARTIEAPERFSI